MVVNERIAANSFDRTEETGVATATASHVDLGVDGGDIRDHITAS